MVCWADSRGRAWSTRWMFPSFGPGSAFSLSLYSCGWVDEIRDYEYDREHNPERELAAGVVSFSDLYRLLLITALIVLALNSTKPIAADCYARSWLMLSSCGGWKSVRVFIANECFFAIGVAVQLHVMQAIYVWVVRPVSTATAPTMGMVAVIAAFVFAYLHWEVARKTRWPRWSHQGQSSIQRQVGAVASVSISFGLMTVAVTLLLFLLRPWQQGIASIDWLILAPWSCSLLNTLGFLLRTPGEHRLGPGAAIAYFSFLGFVVLGAL